MPSRAAFFHVVLIFRIFRTMFAIMAYKASPKSKAASGGKSRVRVPVWTEEERQFAAAVLRHGNLSKAAREAKPSLTMEASRYHGHMLYHRPHVRAFVEDENRLLLERYKFDADKIKKKLAEMVFGTMGTFLKKNAAGEVFLDLNDATEMELAMVQEATVETYMDGKGEDARPVKSVKIKLVSRTQAAELLGKTLKMFTDKVEHSGVIKMPISKADQDA